MHTLPHTPEDARHSQLIDCCFQVGVRVCQLAALGAMLQLRQGCEFAEAVHLLYNSELSVC